MFLKRDKFHVLKKNDAEDFDRKSSSPRRRWMIIILFMILIQSGSAENRSEVMIDIEAGSLMLGNEIQQYAHTFPEHYNLPIMRPLVSNIVWSHDGSRIASIAAMSSELVLWDAVIGKVIKRIPLGATPIDWPNILAFADNDRALVTFGFPFGQKESSRNFSIIDSQTGEIIQRISGPAIDGRVSAPELLSVSHDTMRVAILFNIADRQKWGGQTMLLYDARTWKPLMTLFTLKNLIVPEFDRDMSISPDGNSLALLKKIYITLPVQDSPNDTYNTPIYTSISGLSLFDLQKGQATSMTRINEENSNPWAGRVRYSPDGRFIAVGMQNAATDSARVRVYDAATGQLVKIYHAPPREKGKAYWWAVHGLDWSPDQTLIAASGSTGQLHILDANSTNILQSITTPGECWAVAFSPDGTRLAYGIGNKVKIQAILKRK